MKKVIVFAGLATVTLTALFFTYSEEISRFSMTYSIKPSHEFHEKAVPAPPDYSSKEHWASLPEIVDGADISPEGKAQDNQAGAAVDVFFLHPTTYYKADSWNQPLDHQEANTFTDEQALTNQASVFNSCCKVYAPRYRQATLYSFFEQGPDSDAAIELAYTDVKSAFRYFIKHFNNDRPFIVAGHSQGSKHLDRLLKEVISNSPLQERMVAAYPVGFPLDGSNGIAVCDSPAQLGCQVTWNAVSPEFERYRETTSDICVNPLSWRKDEEPVDISENLGSINFSEKGQMELAVANAQCKDGLLLISQLESDQYPDGLLGKGNYHIYDYSLFHMNIRENVLARVEAFLNH
ncbi:MAG: DUF3089 domain-containing protein [Endozoicomonas sp.]